MPNIMKMMKQAASLQKNLAEAQAKLAETELEYKAGGGAVTVKIMGNGRIRSIRLDPAMVKEADAEMLEDVLLSAVNGAQDLASETSNAEMSKLTAGMNLPPGFSL